jgi:hypothetical protein
MVEEGNGKGLIFESKTVSTASATDTITCEIDTGATVSNMKYLPLSFDFEPTMILAVLTTSLASVEFAMYGTTYPNILVEKIVSKGLSSLYSIKKTDVITTDNKTFKFPVISTGDFTYYAIGAGTGEGEDTALGNSGGLDIISATALPATGKENQICVITTGNVNKILVSNKASDLTNTTNNVCVYLGEASSPFSGVHTVTSGNINVIYNIDRISYNNNNVNSYVYKEGKWGQLTQSSLVLILNSAYVNTSYGSFPVGNPYSDNKMSNTSSGILMSTSCSSSSSECLIWSSLPNPIDFGPFSKITASINVIESTRSSAEFYLLAFNSNTGIDGSIYTSNMTDLAENYRYVIISEDFTGNKTLTFDISDLTGNYYLGIALLSNKNSESGSYASSFHRAYLTGLSLQ